MAQSDNLAARQRERVEQAIERSRRDVEGRVAVVTGGARGLGKAIATGLLQAGGQGVAVNAIMPGHTRASWFDTTARGYWFGSLTKNTRPGRAPRSGSRRQQGS